MDTSLNAIDLMYLSKLPTMHKKTSTDHKPPAADSYKSRIMEMTKQMLDGTKINGCMNDAFNQYVSICIKHCDFVDKAKIIQTDYLNVKIKEKGDEGDNCSIKEANKIIQRTKTQITIQKFLNIKKKAEFVPKIRDY